MDSPAVQSCVDVCSRTERVFTKTHHFIVLLRFLWYREMRDFTYVFGTLMVINLSWE